jgi:choline dehydrogenase
MGITYRMNLITASSLGNPDFLIEAERNFTDDQSGILTSPGGDWLGKTEPPKPLVPGFC